VLRCLGRQYSVGRQGAIQRAGVYIWVQRVSPRVWLRALLYWQVFWHWLFFTSHCWSLIHRHVSCWRTMQSSLQLERRRRSITRRTMTSTWSAYSEAPHGQFAWWSTLTRKSSIPLRHYLAHLCPRPRPHLAPGKMTSYRNWTILLLVHLRLHFPHFPLCL
jgi:hypothetical protein